jgi:ribosomal protein S2
MKLDGTWDTLNKREKLFKTRQRDKLEKTFGSIAEMTRQPAAIFIVDILKEHIALAEARRLNIPTFAMVDTNSNPKLVDFPIPSNDDATKSITLIMDQICLALSEGLEDRKNLKEGGNEESTESSNVAAEAVTPEVVAEEIVAEAVVPEVAAEEVVTEVTEEVAAEEIVIEETTEVTKEVIAEEIVIEETTEVTEEVVAEEVVAEVTEDVEAEETVTEVTAEVVAEEIVIEETADITEEIVIEEKTAEVTDEVVAKEIVPEVSNEDAVKKDNK